MTYTTPRGVTYPAEAVIEALSPLILPERREKMEAVLDTRLSSVALGVEDLHHEHNGSACIRSAEGLGIHHIYAAEVRNAYPHPEVSAQYTASQKRRNKRPSNSVRGGISMHAHRWVNLETFKEREGAHAGINLIETARARGYRVFGAGPRGRFELSNIPVDRPLLVLFGNEARGLRDDTMNACDEVFRIPMYGFTESFNISVSVGMTLEQLGARRRAILEARGLRGDLGEDERTRCLARWFAREMKSIDQLLAQLLG